MSRFFAFGCSFTKFDWPTWADIVGTQFDESYNFGCAGAGNFYIFNRLITKIAEHNITDKDTVMIMWTNVTREDRFIKGRWITPGHIFNQDYYPKGFVKNFVDIRGCFERDIPLFHAAQLLLDKIGCKHQIMSMIDIVNTNQYGYNLPEENIDHLFKLYKNTLDRILPSVHKTLFNNDWHSVPTPGFSINLDPHPLPLQHLEYLEKMCDFKASNDLKEKLKLDNEEAIRLIIKKHN
jgi:hypothetical protein